MHTKTVVITAVLFVVCLSFGAVNCCASETPSGTKDLRAEFDSKYEAWVLAQGKWISENPFLSYTAILPEEKALVAMGPSVVPFMIEKFEKELSNPEWNDRFSGANLEIVWFITCKKFREDEWPEGKFGDHQAKMEMYVKWWKEGRKKLPETFNTLYAELESLPKNPESESDKAKEKDILDRIRSQGVEALPLIIQKIKGGDKRFLPMVAIMKRFTDADAVIATKLSPAELKAREDQLNWSTEEALAWWEANKERLKFPGSVVDIK
ncbi:MAG: hypothetical protein ABFD64_05070 [Armatimonadota bacterium]